MLIAGLATSKNLFGKQQNTIDLEADKIIFKHLKLSNMVHTAASEESPNVSLIFDLFNFWFTGKLAQWKW